MAQRIGSGFRSKAVAVAVLVLAGVLVSRSGAMTPRISTAGGWSGAVEDGSTSTLMTSRSDGGARGLTRVSQSFTIVNDGWFPLEIVGVDTDRPGMHVERAVVGDGLPHLLRHNESATVTVHYDITDCAAVSSSPQPVPVRVERWFGEQSIPVSLRPLHPYREGGWAVSNPGDPQTVQWQRFLADYTCDVPYPEDW
ncbi:hypothetical protein ACWKSP_34820 [Micromonosporaceae bacterium Da 78-11]